MIVLKKISKLLVIILVLFIAFFDCYAKKKKTETKKKVSSSRSEDAKTTDDTGEESDKKKIKSAVNWNLLYQKDKNWDQISGEIDRINKEVVKADKYDPVFSKYGLFFKEALKLKDLEVETKVYKKWYVKLIKCLNKLSGTYFKLKITEPKSKESRQALKQYQAFFVKYCAIVEKPDKIPKEKLKKLREAKRIRDRKRREEEKKAKRKRRRKKKKKSRD